MNKYIVFKNENRTQKIIKRGIFRVVFESNNSYQLIKKILQEVFAFNSKEITDQFSSRYNTNEQ
jgi:hypothetical protein